MMNKVRSIVIYLAVAIPTLGQVHRFGGLLGVVLYLGLLLVLLLNLGRIQRILTSCGLDRRNIHIFGAILLVVLFLAFLYVYPKITRSCDRDEAINDAVHMMAHGQPPYLHKTFQGHPISDFPGSLLLAAPFVLLLGNSSYQNFFWLAALWIVISRSTSSNRLQPLVILTVFVMASPQVLWEILSGSDLLSNSIFAGIAFYLCNAMSRDLLRQKSGLLVFFLLGLTLSSRPNFAFILAPAAGYMVRRVGPQRALALLAAAVAGAALVTVPVFTMDPSGFAPLHSGNILKAIDVRIPYASTATIVIECLIAVACAFAVYAGRLRPLAASSILLLWPCIPVILFITITGSRTLQVYDHGINYLGLSYFYIFGYALSSGVFALLHCVTDEENMSTPGTIHPDSKAPDFEYA